MNLELVEFLSGTGVDRKGRTIGHISNWDFAQLESCHDYIQWVFPNRTRSKFNPNAPILDDAAVIQIKSNPRAIHNIRRMFARMTDFYGLTIRQFEDGSYQLDLDDATIKPWWITRGNHNFLRLTRILLALREFALIDEFDALADILDFLGRRYHGIIGDETIRYWRDIADQCTAKTTE